MFYVAFTVSGDERVTQYLELPYVFMLWGYGDVETEGRRDGDMGRHTIYDIRHTT